MQKLIIFICIIFFLGCTKYQAPDLNITNKRFSVEIDGIGHILYISKSSEYYFVLFDAFGVPKANKVLKNDSFKSMKFLPKDSFYDEIFIQSLDILDKNLKNKDFILENKQIRMVEI